MVEMIYHVSDDNADGTAMKLVGVGFDARTRAALGRRDRRCVIVGGWLFDAGARRRRHVGERLGRDRRPTSQRERQRDEAAPALELRDVRKSFGNDRDHPRRRPRDRAGERHAIIGPNGAGKSTLFNLISGRFALSAGPDPAQRRRHHRPEAVRDQPQGPVAQLPDHQHLPQPVGVREPALRGALVARLPLLVLAPPRAASQDARRRAEEVLERSASQRRRDAPAGMLTYAEQRALEIGITIAGGAERDPAGRADRRHEPHRDRRTSSS